MNNLACDDQFDFSNLQQINYVRLLENNSYPKVETATTGTFLNNTGLQGCISPDYYYWSWPVWNPPTYYYPVWYPYYDTNRILSLEKEVEELKTKVQYLESKLRKFTIDDEISELENKLKELRKENPLI